jgi:hypothetical protein
MKADKATVVDEIWDDVRVRSFLHRPPPSGAGGDADFHTLLRAYRSMRPGDFERFIGFFVREGGRVDARDARGRTLAEVIAGHRHGQPFIDAMRAALGGCPA